jgi:hypothetical protein
MLRLLNSRHAEAREKRIHRLVITVVAILEAATYGYMSYRYEHPATWAAWALILSRALAAPLLSVYLSMARPLPVTSRDILYQVELAAGQGVIRDVVEVASDQGAPLAEKIALYGAAATMTAHDRGRLDGMIEAVQKRAATRVRTGAPEEPRRPPTGPGAPLRASDGAEEATSADMGAPRRLRPVSRPQQAAASGGTNPRANRRSRRGVRTRLNPDAAERAARAAWVPGMSVGALQKAAGISRNSASKFRRILMAEEAQQVAQ